MKALFPASIKREIETHLEGMQVRYITDQFGTSAPSKGPTMDIVCEWVAADNDHIAWVIGTKVERVMILSRKTGRSRTWEVGGDRFSISFFASRPAMS